METYSVKQIAELLETNPETVRRWIREKKLKAVQVSRKEGNVVSEDDLRRFLSSTPKYFSKLPLVMGVFSPVVGIAPALVSGIMLGNLLVALNEKSKLDLRISPEELRKYILESIQKLRDTVEQKQALIRQTEVEVREIQRQIEQLTSVLDQNQIELEKKGGTEETKED